MKMIHVIKGSIRLAAAAALIGGAALLSHSATPASADIPTCHQAEFCLYVNADANGGIYRNDGSDRNLNNDRYEVHNLDITVGNTARNAYNNGKPAFRDDVVIYAKRGWHGASDCIKRGEFGALPRNWWNNIESYRWVTNRECKAAGPPLNLGNHNIPGHRRAN
jgi:Peptidase inhibitor family I36